MKNLRRDLLIVLGTLSVLYALPRLAFAAPPRIDSLKVNEGVSHLLVYGQFGVFPGNVFVGSTEPIIKSWTDTLLECSIPPSGAGSCGPVVVTNAMGASNTEMLTMWICHLDGESVHSMSCGVMDIDIYQFDLYWRLDIQTYLQRHTSARLDFRGTPACSKFEYYNHYASTLDWPCDSGDHDRDNHDTIYGYSISGHLDILARTLKLDPFALNFLFNVPAPPALTMTHLDSNFNLIDMGASYGSGGYASGVYAHYDSVIGIPPKETTDARTTSKARPELNVVSNPIRGGTRVTLSLRAAERCRFEVVDQLGAIVRSDELQANSSSYSYYWNTSALAPGMYFYRLTGPDGIVTGKAIVLPK